MYGYTAFRGSIGLIPHFHGCGWNPGLAALLEAHKVVEAGFTGHFFYTVHKGITAAVVCFGPSMTSMSALNTGGATESNGTADEELTSA